MKTGGEMLVEACLAYDTDYVDVNGEIPFTHKLLEYHRYARQKGVFVVPNTAMVRADAGPSAQPRRCSPSPLGADCAAGGRRAARRTPSCGTCRS
eukprot:scaffold1421_cov293-Prasinococcus_capsulatus_cf.AAC.3